jgi:integrase
MPTITFNDRRLAGLKPQSRRLEYFDAALPGFSVRVTPEGRKTFYLLHRVGGKLVGGKLVGRKLQRLTLIDPETNHSTYPDVTLAKARELARAALQKSSVGCDPGAERKQARTRTFGALADLYVEQHARRKKKSWRDDARMIRQELDTWRDRPIGGLRRSDVRDLLEAIVARGAPILANRVLALVRKILNFGLDREWVEANVAAKMARPAAEQSRSRVLTADELRTIWSWLERPAPDDVDPAHWKLAQSALKLRLLTAQRGGEVITMRWANVDLEAGWWTIPAEHSKNKLPHRVPLTVEAMKIVAELLATAPEKAIYLFAGIRGPRHRRGVLDALPIADVRPHDFRRTAATMMASAGIPRLVIAKVLNHVSADAGVTAIYDRASYDTEKRVALETWERTLIAILTEKDSGKVRPFARASS